MNIYTYSDLKALVAKKNLAWQYEESASTYRVFAVDSGVEYSTVLYKAPITVGGLDSTEEAANTADFEAHYKVLANFPIGNRNYPFSTPDFVFNGSGILATAAKNSTTNVDFKIPGALGTFQYLNGAVIITDKAVFGDWAGAVVVDVDNLLGYGAGFVLANYVTRWYINPSKAMDIETSYAGKVPAGMYIRVVYHSVGTVDDVGIAINYRLHTPL